MTTAAPAPEVAGFWDDGTGSVQYVVADPATRRCAVIDPVLDFDPHSGRVATKSADLLLDHIARHGLTLDWILDTHPHADHFSAAGYLTDVTGARTGIGDRVRDVQQLWSGIYDLPESFRADGSQWDHLFADGERFQLGSLEMRALFTPGHTLCSVAYVLGDAAFIHDTMFMPDTGTARADFPGGDARVLWQSIRRILALPDSTRLFTGHDYCKGGRPARWESTVRDQKAGNAHLRLDEAGFVRLRQERDATLPLPRLMLPALQVNIAAGRLPAPGINGRRCLRIPLDAFPGAPWAR